MDEPHPPSGHPATSERLDSWKEIAAYLGRGVTTVQRWEQEEGLPVRRLQHAKKGSVCAFRHELDAWRMARTQSGTSGARSASNSPIVVEIGNESSRDLGTGWTRRHWVAAVAAFALLATALGVTWTRDRAVGAPVTPPTVPRPLANDIYSESSPSLSPDGNEVVYRWRRPDASGLYIKPVAGGAARRLALDGKSESRAGFPKWSPRGGLIAFLVPEEQDVRGLHVVSAAGGSPRHLTSISGIGLCWAPDGRSIAFADRNASGEPFSIFTIAAAGGGRQRLTTPPHGSFGDTDCAFSPDGQRLAVARYPSRYQSDVYLIELDQAGNNEGNRLTTDFDGIAGLDWTPDAQTIVFGSHTGLWRVSSSAGANQAAVPLLPLGSSVSSPTVSRSGASQLRLVYAHTVRDVNIWRWSARADLQTQVGRLESSTWWEDHPALSPNGQRVAFTSNRTGANEIWVSRADGADPRQVTFQRGPVVVSPQWSPDGERLVFSSQVGGNRDIYVMQADGSKSRRLTWEASHEEFPSWSRDGRWIYFRSDRSGTGQIWKMSLTGGTAVRVTPGEASQGFESPDGKLLYFVRGVDVPGVWAVPVVGGEEVLVQPDVREAYWGVADAGIAFLVTASAGSPGPASVRFFNFATRNVTTLADLPSQNTVMSGFAVARDARSVLWTSMDRSQSDLLMFDPWR